MAPIPAFQIADCQQGDFAVAADAKHVFGLLYLHPTSRTIERLLVYAPGHALLFA